MSNLVTPEQLMDNAHIIFLMESHDAHCQHCGDRYRMKLPMPITDMVRRIEAFVLLHADCKESVL